MRCPPNRLLIYSGNVDTPVAIKT
ncbi:unnamed protein product, partial [Rotaria magnacalcarata]